MPPALANNRDLPSKEKGLFRELLTLYETRQLKKALKTSELILKKFPQHGETLAMKGLVCVHLGRREEGLDIIKDGAKKDLKSHIVWHVFGLVQKGEKNWAQAATSYSMGLRFDKDNQALLRDLAHLQTQLRQYDALIESRRVLLRSRPNLHQNWTALAVAFHLAGDLKSSEKILKTYSGMVKNIPDYDYSHSEILLYHVQILYELAAKSTDSAEKRESLQTAVGILDASAKSRAIVDRTRRMEWRALLLTALSAVPPEQTNGKAKLLENGEEDTEAKEDEKTEEPAQPYEWKLTVEAEEAWMNLIDHNSDNADYYRGYLQINSTTPQDPLILFEKLQSLSELYPKARLPHRMALDYASDSSSPTFTELVTPYLKSGLEKGIPSLFTEIKALYADASKRTSIESVVSAILSEVENGKGDPSTELWTLVFLGRHHAHLASTSKSWKTRQEHGKTAYTFLDRALLHTPTLPETHIHLAQLHKHLHDPSTAALHAQYARLLDAQDRFLNTKTAKFLFRAGQVEEGEKVLSLFTRGDAKDDLVDMQSLFFAVEEASAYLSEALGGLWTVQGRESHGLKGKIRDLGRAIKRVDGVVRIFSAFADEQYDFHGYSLRKSNLQTYIDLVRWESTLHLHPEYIRAMVTGICVIVGAFDEPVLVSDGPGEGGQKLTDEEKKAKKKAAKKAAKTQFKERAPDLEAKKGNTPSSNEDKGLEPPAPTDNDPEGVAFLQAAVKSENKKDLLDKGWKWLVPVLTLLDSVYEDGSRDKVKLSSEWEKKIWEVVYDLSIRRGKWLVAVKALRYLKIVGGDQDVELRWRIIDLATRALREQPSAPISEAFKTAFDGLLSSEHTASNDTLLQWNSSLLQEGTQDARNHLCVAKGSVLLGDDATTISQLLLGTIKNEEIEMDVPTAKKIRQFLIHTLSLPDAAEEFRIAGEARWGETSIAFKSDEEQKELGSRLVGLTVKNLDTRGDIEETVA
ncbi:NMDA receptor-regulated protein 1-domain-containing protein [Flagelloscypha sp. PMI_526]|nr:NMDA receptor-regulated protein 1-domain-containing protein [Flagelloscypha sp. PMI_526]